LSFAVGIVAPLAAEPNSSGEARSTLSARRAAHRKNLSGNEKTPPRRGFPRWAILGSNQ
jgi:hypothetical protein